MGNWYLIACLSVTVVGVIAFLRLVSNEIYTVEREAEVLRKMELARKRRGSQDAALESAA